MNNPSRPPDDPVERPPLGQRLFDNVFLLLAVGMLITPPLDAGWGMWEIMSMPQATLP